MKHGLHLTHGHITDIFREWKSSRLNSYLIDISVSVLEKMDEDGTPLVEKILDVAAQKGTGRWTLEESIARGVYIPTIFEAVFARIFHLTRQSVKKAMRSFLQRKFRLSWMTVQRSWEMPCFWAIIVSYAQGMALIAKASDENDWDIDLADLIGVWRAGCIIRQ